MPYVSVHVDGSEVLEEMDDKDLEDELQRRRSKSAPIGSREIYENELLEQVYFHFRDRGGAPECLRDYIYRRLGRCLP